MKIVKVIHGYPPRYNAGSEVCTQMLCHALAERHEVHVFTREESPFTPIGSIRCEPDLDDTRVMLHIVNSSPGRSHNNYRNPAVDQRFAEMLEKVQPDIVHVGHLNHLSTSLLKEAANRSIPIIFTLHDYWLMCPRGQFMQAQAEDPNELWAVCDGQQDRKCAERCYAGQFTGGYEDREVDVLHWSDWVGRRMKHTREISELVDMFIAPSQYLYNRFQNEFGLPVRKLTYLDYGFDVSRLQGRKRTNDGAFTFGYIGTHTPAKGIQDLLQAFGQLSGHPKLVIWGRPRPNDTELLKAIAKGLPGDASGRVVWLSEYRNQEIVADVFNQTDAIVVPSIWVENSPLVIHEAQQARVPVITADIGGMAEHVDHEVNGLLFEHRSPESMAIQMQRFVDDPDFAKRLGERGYVWSDSGDVPDILEHARDVEKIYNEALSLRDSTALSVNPAPWRITFDTNPDHCNMQCIMCEEHSPYSPLQKARRAEGRSRRVMPIETLRRVVADAVPKGLREIIPSTMGEPLLYKDFNKILALCSEHKIQMNLTTNGTFPKLGAKAWAELIVPVTSDIKISWNGATKKVQERIMIGSNWEQVLSNVRDFIDVRDAHAATGGNRCRVTFQLTFLETNVGQLADIVRLAAKLGVDRVKGHHLWDHFDEIKAESMRRSPGAVERWNKAVLQARAAVDECRLPNGERVLLENIFSLDETATDDLAKGGPCPFLGQEAWVSAEGRFNPCCAPDAQRQALGDFGNINDQGLLDIWHGDKYQQFVASYRNHSLCLNCNMRQPSAEDTARKQQK